MSFYATGDGDIVAKDKKSFEKLLEIINDNKMDIDGIDASIDVNPDDNNLSINLFLDYDDYEESETYAFLDALSPYITSGKIEYSGEEDSHWTHKFDSKKSRWSEVQALLVYEDDLSSLSDKSLKEELKRRGYTVTKTAAKAKK